MRYETGSLTYVFDELQVVPDHECYVWGEAEITFETESADPDVGYRGGISYAVENIILYADEKGKAGLQIDVKSDIYKMINAALYKNPHQYRIVEMVEESLEDIF